MPFRPGDPTLRLRPLLYSLDTFLPFVNLHQEAPLVAGLTGHGLMRHRRSEFERERTIGRVLPVGPDHRGMALERDLRGGRHRPAQE